MTQAFHKSYLYMRSQDLNLSPQKISSIYLNVDDLNEKFELFIFQIIFLSTQISQLTVTDIIYI